MSRIDNIFKIREKLKSGEESIGSWMQISNSSVAEIMGQGGFDWIAIDMEHGSFSVHQLPDLFRAIEIGGTLPLVRVAEGKIKDCKNALDSGAGGIIVPNIESASQLEMIRNYTRWPPSGTRGVGFSRANLFGEYFDSYREEAKAPILVAMIENKLAIKNIEEILKVDGLDAILIGPYDLSASLGIMGEFDNQIFIDAISLIHKKCTEYSIPVGIHVIEPSVKQLEERIIEGYKFLAFSIDSVMLRFSNLINLRSNK